jgi:hypothetical protein
VARDEPRALDGVFAQQLQQPLHSNHPEIPREIIVGEVMSRAITAEALSRSKVRHTKCCDIVYFLF